MVDVVVVDVIPVMPLVTRLLVSCARLTFDDVLSPPSAARINFQIMKLCTGEFQITNLLLCQSQDMGMMSASFHSLLFKISLDFVQLSNN